ncbi:MAG: alanine racemase [Proteobacteria bacterium]|nr:alanine racemase [Pseudomonadota bacterium]
MTEAAKGRRWTRRAAIVGGGLAVAGGVGVLASRKSDHGGAHDRYFANLSAALRKAGIAHPVLVIDQARLDRNIAAARATLKPKGLPLRVVVKSLPAAGLVDHVARGMATNRFMVFNGAMLEIMAARPDADLLLGKPLPEAEFAGIIDKIGAEAAGRIQWLIDTPARLSQYAAIAAARSMALRTNMEIDVGLHRGGFPDGKALAAAVDLARTLPHVTVGGLMGYDAHVPKMSDPDEAYAASQKLYRSATAVLREKLGVDPATLTLNGAGSPTYARHAQGTAANEVSVGSAFVKPVDFDLPSLARHAPASFIATPVIKSGRMELPGNEWLTGPLTFMDPNAARAFFIYGGHWLATPVSPPGLQYSDLYGRSSNQEMLTGSTSVALKPDDHVFFRPNQSEAVFLQFGDIVLFNGETIAGSWPTFPVSA